MSNTLPNRLRQAAQYTGLDSMRELLIEAAGALEVAQQRPAEQGRPTDDHLWDQTLRERDDYHEWADRLAGAIAFNLGVEIGEHSNINNPWRQAIDAIEEAIPLAERACTCHPDDAPPNPCAMKYSFSECKKAAAQPQERKPLTDEQITAACSAAHATCKLNTRIRWSVVFTRAIEAAHGIKD